MLEGLRANTEIKRPAGLVLVSQVVDLRFKDSRIQEVERCDSALHLPVETGRA